MLFQCVPVSCVCVPAELQSHHVHIILTMLELPCCWSRTLNSLNITGFLQSHCSSLARSLWMFPSFTCVTCPAELPVSCKGAGGALDPILCDIDNDIKEPKSHGRVLTGYPSSLTSTCTWKTGCCGGLILFPLCC